MAVITWYRTEEFYPVKLSPGSMSHNAMRHTARNGIKHDIQTGISINNNVIRIYL